MRGQHVLESRQRTFCPVLLPETEAGIEDHDDENNGGILQVANDPGESGGKQQDDDQEVLELIDELEPERTRCRFDHFVLAVRG